LAAIKSPPVAAACHEHDLLEHGETGWQLSHGERSCVLRRAPTLLVIAHP
jgi:hypothetical protein